MKEHMPNHPRLHLTYITALLLTLALGFVLGVNSFAAYVAAQCEFPGQFVAYSNTFECSPKE